MPHLWAGRPQDELVREKLRVARYPLEWRAAAGLKPGEELDWLAGHRRVTPGSGASLALDGSAGPLKPGDRIVSIGGVKIADDRDYARFMDEAREEKPVAVLVQRGKERVRAEWTPESRELLILSRGVAEMRIDLPEAWVPATLNWNGQETGKADAAGCWIVGGASWPCAGR